LSNIEHIAKAVLPYIHNFHDMRLFTDHGYSHSLRVMKYIEKLIEIYDHSSEPLNTAEQHILRCSCWLHDLGCISEREKHAKKSVKIIRTLTEKGILDLEPIKAEIEYVIYTHSSKGLPIDDVPECANITGFEDRVRVKLLCALFRLADECDIDKMRAPKVIFDLLEDEMTHDSKLWWRGHSNIIGVYFSDKKIQIVLKDSDSESEGKRVAASLISTVEDLKPILREYHFPYTKCELILQKSVDIDE